ncbi:RNA polymerase-associated protein RapA [Chiayiivirga flava]|uniref:RNA polymerase-associated protein RapA n=1 Tax=Chiayiivirga flava TaxID=659595 RepID=A0A7W8G0Y1_9GAMM|nr:RNA polymerase-associated protein RapA [Chiayiivirga flava]MBB5208268.1 ATP-dependent helicase HepA [Chiayiivirga flava]
MTPFVPGQRWFSTAEPELGLGTVLRLAGRSVQIVFTGSGVVRQYAMESAPMARAEFRIGDRIRAHGQEYEVEAIDASAGLLTYRSRDRAIAEGELDAEQPVSQADARLLGGRVDRNDQFDFRLELLRRRAGAQQHPGAGVQSARIDLIPHQLRAAETAGERRPPRLLLADEVGLGKTIEACLVIAQQLASARVARVLVLVPESLVHQWFVELLRRFNLRFAIFDEERCESIETAQPDANPFEDEQGVIAATSWLANDAKRRRQLLDAGWDLLVVDEAHHLAWSADAISPEYALVETLAAQIPGALLLTATPEQLGLGGHFARLRLLDPARYSDLRAFEAETHGFVALSGTVEKLLHGDPLLPHDIDTLAALLGPDADALPAHLARIESGNHAARDALIDMLIDRHGTGRVMIRNRRAAVGGFPQRVKHLARLDPVGDDPSRPGRLLTEFHADVGTPGHIEPEHDYTHDPRMDWLLGLLDEIAPAKLLLLCRSRAKVQALEEALRLRSGVAVARFHEDMNLLQRDRNAAYFAQVEDGARLLIASEIGAEGRNFQFAQHLALWDLPLDPDMLEQRIGRLDRIGQRGDVHIHAAALIDSAQELLLRWYDDGLDAFTQVCADGRELMRRFGGTLVALAQEDASSREPRVEQLLEDTRVAHAELSALIAGGRDRLLELASRRGAEQGLLRDALARDDRNATNDDFAWRLLEQFGVQHESLSPHIVLLDPEYLTIDAFEEFKSGPRQATTDRGTALARDDVLYLRDDHPLLLAAQDLLLSGETGNAAFLVDDNLPPRSVLLECVFVLECVAQKRLQVARYLPTLPIRCVIDTRLTSRPDFVPGARALQRSNDRPIDLVKYRKILAALLPPMLKRANQEAATESQQAIEQALAHADELLGHELARLEALARVNPAVHPEEIVALREEREALLAVLPTARPRLDALRLVASPDFLALRS